MDSTARNNFDGLWSVSETARRLRLSESFIRKSVAKRTIPHVRIGGRILFDPADLREWIDERKAAA